MIQNEDGCRAAEDVLPGEELRRENPEKKEGKHLISKSKENNILKVWSKSDLPEQLYVQ